MDSLRTAGVVSGPLARFEAGFRAELQATGYTPSSQPSAVTATAQLSGRMRRAGLEPGALTRRCWPRFRWGWRCARRCGPIRRFAASAGTPNHGPRGHAVFGGLAMAAHGFDRGTRNLDLFVAPDERNVERLRNALPSVFDDPDIAAITAEDLGGDYPAVQYGPPEVDDTTDIVISGLGDGFRVEDLELERGQAGEVTMTAVTTETHYRREREAARLRDRDDAQRLARAFECHREGER